MQIVIDIPKEDYILAMKEDFSAIYNGNHIAKAIKNGTPLDDIKAEIAEYKDDKVIHAERNEIDAISREAVLNEINEICFSKKWAKYRNDYGSKGQIDLLFNFIETMPSVTPSRQGHWIITPASVTKRHYQCSE